MKAMLLERKKNREERARPKSESFPPDAQKQQNERAALLRDLSELGHKPYAATRPNERWG